MPGSGSSSRMKPAACLPRRGEDLSSVVDSRPSDPKRAPEITAIARRWMRSKCSPAIGLEAGVAHGLTSSTTLRRAQRRRQRHRLQRSGVARRRARIGSRRRGPSAPRLPLRSYSSRCGTPVDSASAWRRGVFAIGSSTGSSAYACIVAISPFARHRDGHRQEIRWRAAGLGGRSCNRGSSVAGSSDRPDARRHHRP